MISLCVECARVKEVQAETKRTAHNWFGVIHAGNARSCISSRAVHGELKCNCLHAWYEVCGACALTPLISQSSTAPPRAPFLTTAHPQPNRTKQNHALNPCELSLDLTMFSILSDAGPEHSSSTAPAFDLAHAAGALGFHETTVLPAPHCHCRPDTSARYPAT
eukprot:3383225-Rhodomonas_salina.1